LCCGDSWDTTPRTEKPGPPDEVDYPRREWAMRTHHAASLRQMNVTTPCKAIKTGQATQ